MSGQAECAMCHLPVRSSKAKARGIGGGCWRKLAPAQRAAVLRVLKRPRTPGDVRAALNQAAPAGDGQLPIDDEAIDRRSVKEPS